MQFTPLPPQLLMDAHLQRCPNALLFCGMGISKTAACLNRLCQMFRNGESVGALIIAPLRVASLTWPAECRDWDEFRWLKVANLRTEGGQRAFLNGRAHLYLLNYEAMALLVNLIKRRKNTLPYDTVIFDELTRAKSHDSKRIRMYRNKVPRAERNWGLTGTPMPNSHIDLFAQVRLIDDGERLGEGFTEFKKHYFYPTEGQRPVWLPKQETPAILEKKISDITLTLKSSDWLNLPDMCVEDIEIKFSPELQERYEKLEEELVIELRKDKTINVANSAALITKLLQFTSGEMYDDEKISHPIHNLKFDALKKLASQVQPLFVAYIYKHEEKRIREQFPHAQFFSDRKSSNPEKTIAAEQKLMKEWNDGKIKMLCAHPASVGHGLNLQYGGCSIAWISRTYNREYYEQMIYRFFRRGQDKVVKVYHFTAPATVDDAVAEALATKAENEARLIAALQMLESYRQAK